MNQFMWNSDRKEQEYKQATNKVENFFDELKDHKKKMVINSGVKLTYRMEQHRLAQDIMSAIRDN